MITGLFIITLSNPFSLACIAWSIIRVSTSTWVLSSSEIMLLPFFDISKHCFADVTENVPGGFAVSFVDKVIPLFNGMISTQRRSAALMELFAVDRMSFFLHLHLLIPAFHL